MDNHALAKAASTKTIIVLISPGMPTGNILTHEEWEAVTQITLKTDAWLLYDAAMERILYDQRRVIHPASFPNMKERTITVGAASKELRMIGWRVGWGENAKRYVRFVFSNEPEQRLVGVGEKLKKALAIQDRKR